MTHFHEVKPIQTAFDCHVWRSPDTLFKAIFAKLNLSCELDALPGVVIVTDAARGSARATEVKNLRLELPVLLSNARGPVVFWLARPMKHEREQLISGLTPNPVFLG